MHTSYTQSLFRTPLSCYLSLCPSRLPSLSYLFLCVSRSSPLFLLPLSLCLSPPSLSHLVTHPLPLSLSPSLLLPLLSPSFCIRASLYSASKTSETGWRYSPRILLMVCAVFHNDNTFIPITNMGKWFEFSKCEDTPRWWTQLWVNMQP